MRASKITTILLQTVTNKLFIVAVCAAVAMVLGALSVGAAKYVFKPVEASQPAPSVETASTASIQHQTERVVGDTVPAAPQPVPVAQNPESPSPAASAPKITAQVPVAPANPIVQTIPALHDVIALDVGPSPSEIPANPTAPLVSVDGRMLSLQVTSPLPTGGLSIGVHLP
jgi:hypothetical protein